MFTGFLKFVASLMALNFSFATTNHKYIYIAVPGIKPPTQDEGGVGILVFDASEGYKLVRRIPTWKPLFEEPPEEIRGIVANSRTGRLFLSTGHRIAAFDLRTDKLLWQKGYNADCCDRISLSRDGKIIYGPSIVGPLGAPLIYVINAESGDQLDSISTSSAGVHPHNTFVSKSGKLYLEEARTPTMRVIDTKTKKATIVGPFRTAIRPFVINGLESLVFVNILDFNGFGIADLKTGKVMHEIENPGAGKKEHKILEHEKIGALSHGIALTHDEKELWVADSVKDQIHIYDATVMPPTYKQKIQLRTEPGWISCSIDGKTMYSSTGEVIDVASKKIVATLVDEQGRLVQSEKIIEIDFEGIAPTQAGEPFCMGEVQ